MTREEILSHVDHTLLKPEATWPQIQTLCDEAIANHTASICINTCYVRQAVEYMAGRIPVCCVVGFPLGAMDTESKAFEAKKAIENGASEVDMVINIGWLKNKQYDDVRNDIAAVKAAVGDKVLKVIIWVGVSLLGPHVGFAVANAKLWAMGVKLFSQVIVILSNYIFSKVLIFKKK